MTRAPADYREFIRVSVDLPLNPKLAMLDEPAAGWAYVVSLCYCGQNLTDGAFPMTVVLRLAGVKKPIAVLLVDAGLWHETGHDCERCPQPLAGMGVVHDYLVHQRSADEAKSLRDARREAGRKGAATRWASNSDGKSHSKRHSNSHTSAMATGWQADGKAMAEVEVEEEKEQKTPPTPPGGAPRKRASRIPDDFATAHVTAEMVAWARTECPRVDHRHETAKFVDYWVAASGANARKLDWVATWRNWMRRAAERSPASSPAPRADDRIAGWQALKTGTADRPLYALPAPEENPC